MANEIDENLYEIRNIKIDNVESWFWAKSDQGAFEGPKNDWNTQHRPNIMKYVQEFDVVVQAGGCQGMYPRLLSDMFGVVYTFEPHPINFYALTRNCNKKNIIKFNAAVGNEHRMISMGSGSETNMGTYRIEAVNEESFTPQLMIDDLPLTKCNLIMLDVEDYEIHALQGAEKTIKKFKPTIFAENGYRCADYMKTLGYLPVDKSSADVIFIPLEKYLAQNP